MERGSGGESKRQKPARSDPVPSATSPSSNHVELTRSHHRYTLGICTLSEWGFLPGTVTSGVRNDSTKLKLRMGLLHKQVFVDGVPHVGRKGIYTLQNLWRWVHVSACVCMCACVHPQLEVLGISYRRVFQNVQVFQFINFLKLSK